MKLIYKLNDTQKKESEVNPIKDAPYIKYKIEIILYVYIGLVQKHLIATPSFMLSNEAITDHRRCQNVIRTSVTHSAITSCTTFLFLPHFDIICDLLLNRHMATWNLFVN